jgi:hypothetical protein
MIIGIDTSASAQRNEGYRKLIAAKYNKKAILQGIRSEVTKCGK